MVVLLSLVSELTGCGLQFTPPIAHVWAIENARASRAHDLQITCPLCSSAQRSDWHSNDDIQRCVKESPHALDFPFLTVQQRLCKCVSFLAFSMVSQPCSSQQCCMKTSQFSVVPASCARNGSHSLVPSCRSLQAFRQLSVWLEKHNETSYILRGVHPTSLA